jgi:2-hydroxycyclohexanecarboxyl-CoA dehydrogenase
MSPPYETGASVALVTGAASGIGRAIVLGLAAAGFTVAAVDRDAAGLAGTAAEAEKTGGNVHGFVQDITDLATLPALVDSIAGQLGPPGVLVNNAAKGGGGRIATVTPDIFDAVFAVSVRASFFLAQAVVPGMVEAGGGRIINVASLIAARGSPDNSHYAGAKAALIGMTRSWALEFAPLGITANVILPALTDTPMTRGAMDDAAIRARAAMIPMGRLASPEDCAALAVFLASPAAGFVTGQVLSANGGEFVGAL